MDALFLQKLLEIPFATPGKILPPLVAQDFLRLSKPIDPRQQGLDHQFLLLLQGQGPGNDIPAVVVEKNRQVHPLAMPRQNETCDVGLPQIPCHGPLKPPGQLALLKSPSSAAPRITYVFQGVSNAACRDPHPRNTAQKIPHFPKAKTRVFPLHLLDEFTNPFSPGAAWTQYPVFQSLRAARFVSFHPDIQRTFPNTPKTSKIRNVHSGFQIGFDGHSPLVRRPRAVMCCALAARSQALFAEQSIPIPPTAECGSADPPTVAEIALIASDCLEFLEDLKPFIQGGQTLGISFNCGGRRLRRRLGAYSNEKDRLF